MFRTYYFTEMPYPYPPAREFAPYTRTNMPNRWVDPDAANQVYHKYFDLVRAVDELGLDLMFNEHHSTLSNLNPCMPLSMAIAARETKSCRILALGNPAANRPDPVRIAEEMAMIDVISHGRLDCGFVRGSPQEISATNATPVDMKPRLYEAIDLITKAWTEHDGPFNWEGDFFHYREVDIVPRPYQQPHPPIWVTTTTHSSAPEIAERGHTLATMFQGTEKCAKIFGAYRDTYERTHGRPAHPDKLSYSGILFVGETDEEALAEVPKIQDFMVQSFRTPPAQFDIPGYVDAQGRAAMLSMGEVIFRDHVGEADPVDLVTQGISFCGSPDAVFEQLKAFFYGVGGFGNLLGMFHSSTMSYDLTRRSVQRFAEQVLPRFREEVYEPWLKENGFKRILTSKGFQPVTS
jgi:alkanesulfonate monooxygenase SsuD/methylene tetrahydromethanopterin reductase-like flavin-dependent oxidoreductase (luciferase family)